MALSVADVDRWNAEAVREAGTWIYALGIYARDLQALPEEERSGEKLLSKGLMFEVYRDKCEFG